MTVPDKFTLLRRDPFARADFIRITVDKADRRPCSFCGQPGRFRYTWWPDAKGRSVAINSLRAFCSVGCYRAYYGVD